MTGAPSPASLRKGMVAAYRYLAFLQMEQRYLIHELFPDHKPWDQVSFPCDRQVNQLYDGGASPLDRAASVLKHLGIDPFEHAAWVDYIGVDLSQVPIIGTVGDDEDKVKYKRPRKR